LYPHFLDESYSPGGDDIIWLESSVVLLACREF